MNSSLKWWHAQANLGWHGFCHYLKKLWPWRKRYGFSQFLRNYASEGLTPFSPQLRAIAHFPSHCTTCGACDIVCPLPRSNFMGPMRLVISGMRGGPSLQASASDLTVLASGDCMACRACEKACPQSIPIVELAQNLRSRSGSCNM